MADPAQIPTNANRRSEDAAGGMLFDEFAIDRIWTALTRVPDPDATLRQAGITRERLRLLESDDEISAALETRRDALVNTPWRLEPYDVDTDIGTPVDWVWRELEPWMDCILRDAWSAVPYGYSVLEAVYEPRADGHIGIKQIGEKPLEWFAPQPNGDVLWLGTAANAAHYSEPLDPRKFLLTRRNGTYRQPYGEAVLSRLYWPWFFRHNAWRFWMQFLERFGTPFILGNTQDPNGFVKAVQQLGFESVLGVAREDKVEAVTQAAKGEFELVERALGRRIQKVILGQTLTSDVGSNGSYAAAQVHDDVREDKRASDARLIQPTVQRLVNTLWALNEFPGEVPTVVLADERSIEKERAERDAQLMGAGLRLSPDYFTRVYDYEANDIEGVGREESAGPPGLFRQPARGAIHANAPGHVCGHLFAEGQPNLTPEQQDVEGMGDRGMAEAGQPIDPKLIRRAVRSASDPDDLKQRLAALLEGQGREQFEEALQRAFIAADVLGFLQADDEAPREPTEASAPAPAPEPAPPAVDPFAQQRLALQERIVRLLESDDNEAGGDE